MFWKDAEPMPDLRRTVMSNPFTPGEIIKAASKMKMNKSPGCDGIPVELIMCAPDCVDESIAEIFNQIASDGDCPKEINHGILVHCKNLRNQEDQHQALDQSFSCLR